MSDIKKVINKLYIDELKRWGTDVGEEDSSKILSNIFTTMDANLRVELMKLAGVYYKGNIREKREGSIAYMLHHIINTEDIEKAVIGEFAMFNDLKDLKAITNKDIKHSKDRVRKEIVESKVKIDDCNDRIKISLNNIEDLNNGNTTKHSKDIKDGVPLDVIKTVLRGKGLETLDELYLDKSKYIVTCVKSGKRMSIKLNEEDFLNTRIVLDLLSITYK